MGTGIGVGISVVEDPAEAGAEALALALRGRPVPAPGERLVLVFLTEGYDPRAVLAAVGTPLGAGNLLGFTVAGVLTGAAVAERGVLVAVIDSDEMRFHVDAAEDLSRDPRRAGAGLGSRLGERLAGTQDEALLLLLPDGVTAPLAGLVEAVFDRLGGRIRYAGGGAGDNLRFLRTYQLLGDRILADAAVAALATSSKPIGVGLAHGWHPVSPPLIVTRSSGGTVSELDWEAAYEVYRCAVTAHEGDAARVAAGFAEMAMRFPLGIPQAREDEQYVVRDPLRLGEDGSLSCLGDVPENSVVRVMAGDRVSLLKAAREAAREARVGLGPHRAAGVLVFYCVSRYLLLREAWRDEVRAVAEAFDADVPVFGCLTFGEIGSIGGGPPAFHNKSLVVCAFPA